MKIQVDKTKLKELLDAVEIVNMSWNFPEGQYGASESWIDTEAVINLEEAYKTFLDSRNHDV